MEQIKNLIKKLFRKINKTMIKFGKKQIAFIVAVSFVLSAAVTIYGSIAASHIDYMIVTLNYEGAKKGLNPDGSRFKINEIKSEKVLKSAVDILGDEALSVDNVMDRITIDSKMPLSAIENTTNAIASGSNYSYNPSEFDVYYSQKKKIGKNNTAAFLEALSKAYKDYFTERYSEKNTILEFDSTKTFEDYDFYEIYTVLSDKVSSMLTYLGNHQQESPTFRSSATGYTFENLANSLVNLRDYDLKRFEAFVVQNQISKNRAEFVRKQNYLADKEVINYESNMQTSDIIKDALDLYDPRITGVAFIPSVDGHDEYYMSRTKTGIDNLAIKSYNKGITANDIREKIDSYRYLSDKFNLSAETPEEAIKTAEQMIQEICSYLEKISSVALMTDNEYVSGKTKDYITFKLPDRGPGLPITDFVKNFIFLTAVFLIIYRGYFWAMEYMKKKNILSRFMGGENEEK